MEDAQLTLLRDIFHMHEMMSRFKVRERVVLVEETIFIQSCITLLQIGRTDGVCEGTELIERISP